MGTSAIQEQRDIILHTIKHITKGDWKVLVVDEGAKKVIDNVVKEDDILNENIANIERIEEKRPMNPDMDAIYLLSPEPHIVDCLMADFERRRYRKSYLVWTALLHPQMRRRIDSSRSAQEQLAGFETLSVDYFPRESHLITFRDPWSFPTLFHPSCNELVRDHMQLLAQKITGICVSLGEYPRVRYYRPRNPRHEANVLCSHLARFVQEELDAYAKYNPNFPPQTTRPTGILLITDRSMDLIAPVIHEFTYQAMAHDLLPITEGEKVIYKTVAHEGTPEAQEKEMEIGEKDKIWVDNRHRHMKDTIEKLMGDFQRFINENPHFTNENGDATSLNAIKDMLAGLPQFQELKEAYSLHLTMAQECMNIFEQRKLPDVASVEQTLTTGLDEDFRKPKNVADQLVRLLDDEAIVGADRLRLVILYIIYRDGLIPEDIQRLLFHSSLPPDDFEVISNLELLGARITKALKDSKSAPLPLFPRNTTPTAEEEEYALSRFQPNFKLMLQEASAGTLDQGTFPYIKPPLNSPDELSTQSQTSLRSAKPTWARSRTAGNDTRQRIIAFMAGGATYSESRACYEVSAMGGKEIFLATSHMLTPSLFLNQVGDLGKDRRRLDLPIDRPKPKAPAHLFEREEPKPVSIGMGGPTSSGQAAGLPGRPRAKDVAGSNQAQQQRPSNPLDRPSQGHNGTPVPTAGMAAMNVDPRGGTLQKKNKHSKGESGEKKIKGFFKKMM